MSGIVVLISGRGSNLAALCHAGLAGQIKCVISNKADANGLHIAWQNNLPTEIIEHKSYPSRTDFDKSLIEVIDRYSPDLIVLAGFMRIFTPMLVNYYSGRMINIHPSLLPAFTGFDAQGQAIAAHVKISGATVHYVTPEIDHGPIIAQGVVPVLKNDTVEDLALRILELEHVIYPFIVKKILAGHVELINPNKIQISKDSNDSKLLGKYESQIYY